MDKITRGIVRRGIEQGIIRFVVDPNMESGTVCAIGDNWFYFGGLTADETEPKDYLDVVGIEDASREIVETIDELKTENPDEYEYYLLYLAENLSAYTNVKCDYMDEDDLCWRVDAWETGDPNEQGKVIAFIDNLTGRVLYAAYEAKNDPKIKQVVDKKRKEVLSQKVLVKISEYSKRPSVIVKTPFGVLSADPETEEGEAHDAIFTSLRLNNDTLIDLLAAKVKAKDETLDLYVWNDIFSEDWQDKSSITKAEIDDLIKSETE